jgi:serralysin
VVTLWDAGSNNTLDLSGFKDSPIINLEPGTFSSCAGLTNNLAIAFTKIDKLVSGPGDDTITVNNDGDTIDRGGGTNTIVFVGSSAQYAVATTPGPCG